MHITCKEKDTYKTLRFFYQKNIVELILKYYKDHNKQIFLQKIKHRVVMREIKK
jgi:hypothetical protein